MKKTISFIFLTILMSILVYAIARVEYDNPIDDFYLIKGGAVMGNITFEANATPTGSTGIILNMSLYTNASGVWGINYTNASTAIMATKTNRVFPANDTHLYSADLPDGLVFIWNVGTYDNITVFIEEDVSLDADLFVTFDNYSNATGHGICNSTCENALIITAGRGQVSNYPVASLDGVANTTLTDESITQNCSLYDSAYGTIQCNQTRKTYNGTGLILTESLITSTVKVNYTIESTSRFVSSNRTVYVEDAPYITLISPSNNGYSATSTILFNYNVTGDSDTYTCQLYSNDTGTWAEEAGGNIATNSSNETTSTVISENKGISWNMRCSEKANSNIYGWSQANYTIIVGTTNPSITILSPADDLYVKNTLNSTGQYSSRIYLNVSDINPDACFLKINSTLNNTNNNISAETYTDGTPFYLEFNVSDGNYDWNVTCNNSVGRSAVTTVRSLNVDGVMPTLSSNINYSSSQPNCKAFTVEFGFSEDVNATFTYNTSLGSNSFNEVDYSTNQTFNLVFNSSYETDFFTNVSVCDRAGNCNSSFPFMIVSAPIPLCTGWSIWSVYDTAISLTNVFSNSTADFVYYWNNTGQSWIYASAAGSLNADYEMGIGDVVHLYESTNTTYFRNKSGTPTYLVNATGGHVFFGLYNSYNFGNISHRLFLNSTFGSITGNSTYLNQGAAGLNFTINYLSSYNNSNQKYVDSIYTWSWNNDTVLGGPYKNGLDTLWSYFDYNLTINVTPSGYVVGNWS